MKNIKLHGELYKYADDTLYVIELQSYNRKNQLSNANKVSDDFKTILRYFDINLLKINWSKSQAMIIGALNDEELNLLLSESNIEIHEKIDYLGFIIDNELKLIPYVNKLAKLLGLGLNSMIHLRDNVGIRAMRQFYFANIQSHINYCAFALLRCRASDIDRLYKLQKRILRIMYNIPDDASSEDIFTIYAKNILPIKGLIFLSAIGLVDKCLNSDDDSLPKIEKCRSTRTHTLQLSIAKKKILKDDITHHGVKLFNMLPNSIKRLQGTWRFMKEVKCFLINSRAQLLDYGTDFIF